MKSRFIIIVTVFMVLFQQANAQNTWRRSIKFGFISHLGYTQKVNEKIYRRAFTPNGYYEPLYSADGSMEINPYGQLDKKKGSMFPSFGYYIYTPFLLNFARIETGFEYNPITSRTLYYTQSLDYEGYHYTLEELNVFHSVSIPLAVGFKLKRKRKNSRIYAGAKLNLTFMDWQLQRSSWTSDVYVRYIPINIKNFANNEFMPYSYSFILGYNWLHIFNFELQYVPQSLFNQNYYDFYNNTPYKNLNYPIIDLNCSITIGWKKSKKDEDNE